MLSCKQLNEQASRYLDGELGLPQKLAFWMHLSICVHCRRYLRQFKLTIATLKNITPWQVQKSLAEQDNTSPPGLDAVDDSTVDQVVHQIKTRVDGASS